MIGGGIGKVIFEGRRRRRFGIAASLLAVPLLGLLTSPSHGQGTAPPPANSGSASQVIELRIGDEIEPIMAEYVVGGIDEAARRRASLVLITMDTPGGLSTSMEEIIQKILASPVPVAIYISPTGARGASAGFFILLSADVAAMAPGTRTGAASPIIAIGGFTIGVDGTLRKKIMNDAMAFMRSYSEKSGGNAKLAETAVTDARAFTESESLDGKLIDYVAATPEELLRDLNGKTVTRFDGTKTTLAIAN